MKKNYYVVTAPENGWDCVRGIYLAESETVVLESIAEEQGRTLEEVSDRYIVHQQSIHEL